MDILEMVFTAVQRNQFIDFLRGDGKYMVETSQYSPDVELTDVGKILSRGVYKAFMQQEEIKVKFEDSLLEMLNKTDFDVYMVCLYISSQLFKEKNELSPFLLDKTSILDKLSNEVTKRKEEIMDGITYPSGYKNTKAWQDLEKFNAVCKEEYHVILF